VSPAALTDKGGGVAVAACGRVAGGPLRFGPLEGLGVEDAQVAVVLLAVVAPEDVKFLVVERRRVVLDLRRAVALAVGRVLALALRGGENPLELERLPLRSLLVRWCPALH